MPTQMPSPDASTIGEPRDSAVPPAPSVDVRRLGEQLHAQTEEVVRRTVAENRSAGLELDAAVEQRFERLGQVSPIQRAAPLNEVTKRCIRWGDAASEVLRETAGRLEASPLALSQSLKMLELCLRMTLVQMCECFDAERQLADDELSRQQDELAFMATHDAHTGLPNRPLIVYRLEQMLLRARHSNTPVAAFFIDLDDFKSVNDTLGHRAGDELLQAVAARLDGVVRDIDALGRLGGDEFVVVAGDMTLMAGPELLAERLLDALKKPIELEAEQT